MASVLLVATWQRKQWFVNKIWISMSTFWGGNYFGLLQLNLCGGPFRRFPPPMPQPWTYNDVSAVHPCSSYLDFRHETRRSFPSQVIPDYKQVFQLWMLQRLFMRTDFWRGTIWWPCKIWQEMRYHWRPLFLHAWFVDFAGELPTTEVGKQETNHQPLSIEIR